MADERDFIDEWPEDQAKRYSLHAREVFEQNLRYREKSFQGHQDYGKWLIASLLAVHGGMIYAINGIRTSDPATKVEGLIDAVGWNLIGVGCVLVTGLAAWLNFQFIEKLYEGWSNPAMLYDRNAWPKDTGRFDPIRACLFVALAFGLLSALCFVFSAVTVVQTLKYSL